MSNTKDQHDRRSQPGESARGRRRTDLIAIDKDHPSIRDQEYRRRRGQIVQLAAQYEDGQRCPEIDYSEQEHEIWRTVWGMLQPLLMERADSTYLQTLSFFSEEFHRIPTFNVVNQKLAKTSNFQLRPVGGLVAARAFFSYLKDRFFLSTQYVRHGSDPLFSPEPDVIHEMIGHAVSLADPDIADINQLLGKAAQNANDEQVQALERVYWYWLEFGVVATNHGHRAVGAALLSSPGELETFDRQKQLKPWDINTIIRTPYDPGEYQKCVFVAPSRGHAIADIRGWIDSL